MKGCRVVLADDHPVVLCGLADLVSMERDFTVIGTATKGRDALARIEALEPDIAVLDISMPDMGGMAILRKIGARELPVRVIFLTATITPGQIAEGIAHGAWAILLKESAPDTLVHCLRNVAGGRRWFSEELLAMADPEWADEAAPGLDLLTRREREIADLVCQGLSNKAIATCLGASAGTIKIHLHNIFQKLRVPNRTALVAFHYEAREGQERAAAHPGGAAAPRG
jgi:DNA-binding NarL/FixJ family response regulator